MSERLENVCDVFVELLSTLDKQMRYKEEKVSAKAIEYIKLSVEFLVSNAYKDNLNNSVRASSFIKDETNGRKNNLQTQSLRILNENWIFIFTSLRS